jgi:type I restriction enzyme S subunit
MNITAIKNAITIGWRLVRFNEFLTRKERKITVDDSTAYNCVGVRWYGRGAFVREQLLGMDIARKQQWIIKSGDIVYNKLFAWKGSFAIADDSVDGCIVSDKFPTYEANLELIDIRFLRYYLQTDELAQKARTLSKGAAAISKLTLNPPQFWDLTIPLPPLEEQQRIVAQIEKLAGKIEEGRSLRRQAIKKCDELYRSIIIAPSVETTPTLMGKLVKLREPDVIVSPEQTYHFAGVYSFGRGLFRQQSQSGIEFSYKNLTRLKAGNFVYPKLMAWEGGLGVVPPECDGLVVSPEFPVFEVDENHVLPETLDVYFRTPFVWSLLANISTGTNIRRRRLHPSNFLKYEFPLPPMKIQQKLRTVRRRGDEMQRLREEAMKELDNLLPSILDKAFKGEL